MNYARSEKTDTLLQNGEVLVAGGNSGAAEEIYNEAEGTGRRQGR